MISTPHGAYWWLRGIGLQHEVSLKLIQSRHKFEYFVRALEAAMR